MKCADCSHWRPEDDIGYDGEYWGRCAVLFYNTGALMIAAYDDAIMHATFGCIHFTAKEPHGEEVRNHGQ